MDPWGELLIGLAIVVGIAGVIVPILPGVLLVWAAVVVWGVVEGGALGWGLAAAATAVAGVSQVAKYVVPGRRLRNVGVPDRTLLIGGLAGVVGNIVGGYGADRWSYGRSLAMIFVVLPISLLAFSLLAPVAGSSLAVAGAGVALITWSVAGWAITPFQQYRLIELYPLQGNLVLSLNASAIYLGQGIGAGLGALAIGYGSLNSLGWVAALYAAAGLVVLLLGTCPGGYDGKSAS